MAKTGLKIHPLFVPQGEKAFDKVPWSLRSSQAHNHQGEILPHHQAVEFPQFWSQVAVDIVVSKYLRKTKAGYETSLRQPIERIAHSIRDFGKKQGYFASLEQADLFSEELKYILVTQRAAFNSPVWFNCGLYDHPQSSACFIQSCKDSLGGIFDLLKKEALLFKYGSGTGTNFSNLRSKYEELDGGGLSSGLMSFLEVFDKAAGATKSGGTTRRAAKMVVLDVDHPEILEFISWKAKEEKKAKALIQAGYNSHFEGEAYRSISGQNSNNSVRVSDAFMSAVQAGAQWSLRYPTTGEVFKELPAQELWEAMALAAWECADPGLQFHDTIQRWHTCPASGPIRASNPCSEYMFLDDSACNLASINLVKFMDQEAQFKLREFLHVCHILIIAQDILVDMSSYPSKDITQNSHIFRPLGLGYANLGGFLMRKGLAYGSEAALKWTALITAFMQGQSSLTSSQLAQELGAFAGYSLNQESMLEVMSNQAQSVRKFVQKSKLWISSQDFRSHPEEKSWSELISACEEVWVQAQDFALEHGYRNAQLTCIAPTGTIGLVMDCDTLGIEPDYSLLKTKFLAGGGRIEIINQSVAPALKALGYTSVQIEQILEYLKINKNLVGAPGMRVEDLGVFDCAQAVPGYEERFLAPSAHLDTMAAAQAFLSGAISKTLNLPAQVSVEDIKKIYWRAWEMGLKSIAVYRDGSKESQPLHCSSCS